MDITMKRLFLCLLILTVAGCATHNTAIVPALEGKPITKINNHVPASPDNSEQRVMEDKQLEDES
jgi:hypothetical protein